MNASITTSTTEASSTNSQSSQQTTQPTRPGKSECPKCHTYVSTVDVEEAVCPECHILVDPAPVNRGPRPTYGGEKDSRKRTGGKVTHCYADRGIGTGAEESFYRRLAADPHQDSKARRIENGLGEVRRIGSILELSSSEVEAASRLYRKGYDEGLLEGRNVEGFAGACILVAIRQSPTAIPISETEIQEVSGASENQFRTARGTLELKLNVEILPMPPEDFLGKASKELDSPWKVIRYAKGLLHARKNDEDAVASVSPRTLAAVSIAVAYDVLGCEQSPTLAELGETFNLGRSTISRRKSALRPYTDSVESSL